MPGFHADYHHAWKHGRVPDSRPMSPSFSQLRWTAATKRPETLAKDAADR